ncbi:hypothetical protein BT67DRAFT_435116 [Trichocladium antarcticum]|uniref:Secreted protein n=1 Tax=Trichocladium antarcticum TaxID=1450529 RepID=A0AAN6ZCY7_9PEZI|nr:hypothetical protein BT67DRAFT_435116 [Trichocladium antarcticum]
MLPLPRVLLLLLLRRTTGRGALILVRPQQQLLGSNIFAVRTTNPVVNSPASGTKDGARRKGCQIICREMLDSAPFITPPTERSREDLQVQEKSPNTVIEYGGSSHIGSF